MPPAYHDRTRSKSKRERERERRGKKKEGWAKVKRGVAWVGRGCCVSRDRGVRVEHPIIFRFIRFLDRRRVAEG